MKKNTSSKTWAFISNYEDDRLPVFLGTGKGKTAQAAYDKFIEESGETVVAFTDGTDILLGEIQAIEMSNTATFKDVYQRDEEESCAKCGKTSGINEDGLCYTCAKSRGR